MTQIKVGDLKEPKMIQLIARIKYAFKMLFSQRFRTYLVYTLWDALDSNHLGGEKSNSRYPSKKPERPPVRIIKEGEEGKVIKPI